MRLVCIVAKALTKGASRLRAGSERTLPWVVVDNGKKASSKFIQHIVATWLAQMSRKPQQAPPGAFPAPDRVAGLVLHEAPQIETRRIRRGLCPRIRQVPLDVKPLRHLQALVRADPEDVAEGFEQVARVEARLRSGADVEMRRLRYRTTPH